ncbi:hypothetical protein YC2023_059373 [Brassica napus]
MDFSFGYFSKARILKLSEYLGHVGTRLVRSERPTALADRPAHVLILSALDTASSDESGQEPNKQFLFLCRVILQINIYFLVGLDVTFQTTIEAGSIIRPFRNLVCRLSNHQISLLWRDVSARYVLLNTSSGSVKYYLRSTTRDQFMDWKNLLIVRISRIFEKDRFYPRSMKTISISHILIVR